MRDWDWESAFWWLGGHVPVVIGTFVFHNSLGAVIAGALISTVFLAWARRDR